MKKQRFRDISLDEKNSVRKERKSVIIFIIGILLCTNIYALFFYPNRLPNVELMHGGYGKLIALVLVLFGVLCTIVAIISLKKLTKLIYQHYLRYFFYYVIFILFGFSLGITLLITLIILWFETGRSLTNE